MDAAHRARRVARENKMASTVNTLKKNGKTYRITFDDEGVLDTVECGGKLLSTKNAACKQIANNADKILRGLIPEGFDRC